MVVRGHQPNKKCSMGPASQKKKKLPMTPDKVKLICFNQICVEIVEIVNC